MPRRVTTVAPRLLATAPEPQRPTRSIGLAPGVVSRRGHRMTHQLEACPSTTVGARLKSPRPRGVNPSPSSRQGRERGGVGGASMASKKVRVGLRAITMQQPFAAAMVHGKGLYTRRGKPAKWQASSVRAKPAGGFDALRCFAPVLLPFHSHGPRCGGLADHRSG